MNAAPRIGPATAGASSSSTNTSIGANEFRALIDRAHAQGFAPPTGSSVTPADACALHDALDAFDACSSLPVSEKISLVLKLADDPELARTSAPLFDHLLTLVRCGWVDPNTPIEHRYGRSASTPLQHMLMAIDSPHALDEHDAGARLDRMRAWVDNAPAALEPPQAANVLPHDLLRCALADTGPQASATIALALEWLSTRPELRDAAQAEHPQHEADHPLPLNADAEVFEALVERRYDGKARLLLEHAINGGDEAQVLRLLEELDGAGPRASRELLDVDLDAAQRCAARASDKVLAALIERGLDPRASNANGRNVFHLLGEHGALHDRVRGLVRLVISRCELDAVRTSGLRIDLQNLDITRYAHGSPETTAWRNAQHRYQAVFGRRDVNGEEPSTRARAAGLTETAEWLRGLANPGYDGS